MNPDLSVVIVSWSCRDELADCLASLAGAPRDVERETIVVDNASADGTAEMVRERFPDVRLIANETNRGFAAANNQGIRLARGRNLLFLNPDTVVREGALGELVRTLDRDDGIGACGARLLGADGSTQSSVRSFPTFAALLHQYTPLRMLGVLKGAYRRYRARDFDYGRSADVDALMGAALCVPRRVLDRVGPFDERFFVYFEEVDLCRRIRAAGLRNRFVAEARITHVGGVSASRAPASRYLCRSMFRYMRKHRGRVRGAFGTVVLWLGMLVRELFQLVLNAIAALAMAACGRRGRARRRWRRAGAAARFLCLDAWRVLLGL
jgi:GT2 family glycosyltransferase